VFLRSALRASDSESARIDRLLELLDLTRLGDEEVSGLPLGPSRLLEVGRALASQPSLVLLDEPSSGLDPHETAELVSVFRQAVNEHGTSLLLVEHDVEMVLGLSDTVYVLDAGNLICEGPPALVRSDPLVIAAYLGTASQGDGRL
jgi:branched-chain amino acid transport system ATP-binding protein